MTNRAGSLLIFGFVLTLLSGCVSLEQTTLPAAYKHVYRFNSYDVIPPESLKWRHLNHADELQTLSLMNYENESIIFLWVTPLLDSYVNDSPDKDIIDYFQNKMLKEMKMDPDLRISDQDIKKEPVMIAGVNMSLLSISYYYKKQKYSLDFYYYVREDVELIHNFTVFKVFKERKNKDWEADLNNVFEALIGNVTFKTPQKKELIRLRVSYALTDFNEIVAKRYLADEVDKIALKFKVLNNEVTDWLSLKDDNFEAYNILADISLFNERFEKYGEGFDRDKAIGFYNKALSIRPYYLEANEGLAQTYLELKDYENAVAFYKKAVQISPNDENLYISLGKIYEQLEDYKSAKEYYEKAMRFWKSGFATMDELKVKIKEWDNKMKSNNEG